MGTLSHTRADDTLSAAFRSPATPHLLLHTGDPGPEGTANVAEVDSDPIDRKAISFAAPSSHPTNTERRVLSDAQVAWSGEEIDAGQEVTHYSIWSADTGGQVEDIGTLAEAKVVGSDGVTVAAGQAEIAIQVYALPA